MNWNVIWKSLKHKDMQKRLMVVLGIVVVYRFLSHIPIPLAEPKTLKQILDNLFNSSDSPQLLSFINVLSGGALANFSIMLVGLGPYINASIIVQLLTKAFPKLEEMQKDGEYGRKKINQVTRMLTFPLAIIQSIGAIYLVRQTANQFGGLGDVLANAGLGRWVLMVAALTGAAMILMWLGELITEQSVGNGISILITVGIISGLPGIIGGLLSSVIDEKEKWVILGKTLPIDKVGLFYVGIIVLVTLLVTMFVIYLNEAQRRVTVSYAKRIQGSRSYGGITTVLPIKLITAGVIPIIFAVAFLSIPQFAGQLMNGSSKYAELGTSLTRVFSNPSSQYLSQIANPVTTEYLNFAPELNESAATVYGYSLEPLIYPALYVTLVIVFTYFYTSVMFNAKEISENLQKQGGFVADIRPGAQTEKYLSSVVTRLTLFGSISLGLLALMPILAQIWLKTDQIAVGGTSILILVSVALETLRQIESKALMVTYDDYSTIGIGEMTPAHAGEAATGAKTRFRFTRNSAKK
jgi:preprotein translocase subunit SecY